MKDINVLSHTSVNHVNKAGDTMTGNLTGLDFISKKNITSNQGGGIIGHSIETNFHTDEHGQGRIRVENKNTPQNSVSMIMNPHDKSITVDGTVKPAGGVVCDLGKADSRWRDLYLHGNIFYNITAGERQLGFYNGNNRLTYIHGGADGSIGMYDSKNVKSIFKYSNNAGYSDIYFSGDTRPEFNDTYHLGTRNHRWVTVFTVNAVQTSDRNYKENIEYVSDKRTKSNKSTYEDMYNFYKDIELARYNYKNQEHTEYGFIAQDIANKKVGSEIALDLEGGYGYSVGSYISTVAGALKQAIKEIETLKTQNQELIKRIDVLENRP